MRNGACERASFAGGVSSLSRVCRVLCLSSRLPTIMPLDSGQIFKTDNSTSYCTIAGTELESTAMLPLSKDHVSIDSVLVGYAGDAKYKLFVLSNCSHMVLIHRCILSCGQWHQSSFWYTLYLYINHSVTNFASHWFQSETGAHNVCCNRTGGFFTNRTIVIQ